jgi:hypothetical protein
LLRGSSFDLLVLIWKDIERNSRHILKACQDADENPHDFEGQLKEWLLDNFSGKISVCIDACDSYRLEPAYKRIDDTVRNELLAVLAEARRHGFELLWRFLLDLKVLVSSKASKDTVFLSGRILNEKILECRSYIF